MKRSNMDNEQKTSFSSINDLYYRMIGEIQDYAIILLDKNGYIRNWNRGAQKIKQYTEQEAIGQHFSIFYLADDLADDLPATLIKQAHDTGRASHEGWRKRKDGTRFWGSITITALHNDDNEIVGFSKVTRDLTDKKIAEDNLRLSEEKYHQMIAEVEDYAIILLNERGMIENWNAGAEKIKGYKSSEVLGKKFEIFYTTQDRENGLPDKLLNEARTTGKAIQEGWRVRKDGTKFWGTIVITALHGKDNRVIGFSKVTRDLTQRRIDEQKMLAYLAELELQNSELEQFAYVASHDLQEPLRKIQTFAELIQRNYADEAFVKKYFEKLDLSAKRMSQLVKALLNYSRLSNDKADMIDVDLNIVLAEVKEDFELMIEEKHAVIANEQLPVVRGFGSQLAQLFANLISNSLKFSADHTHIDISSRTVKRNEITDAPTSLAENEYFEITFKDNGIGFEQQYEKIIFSLFQRLHGRQTYAGTGIGLALCKKIVENHYGYIKAIGEVDKGAKFIIYLPVSL